MAAAQAQISAIIWSDPALADLRGVWDYLAREASPAVAFHIGDTLLARVDALLPFPHRGRAGCVEGTRELVVSGLPYLIIYEIHGTRIVIMRVLHTARRWPPEEDE